MTQTPASFPVHANAAAEHCAKEARKWSDHAMITLMVTMLIVFVFSICMALAFDHMNAAANRATQAAKEARQSADAAWWWKHSAPAPMNTWPDVKIMQCDAEKCEVR